MNKIINFKDIKESQNNSDTCERCKTKIVDSVMCAMDDILFNFISADDIIAGKKERLVCLKCAINIQNNKDGIIKK